MNENIRNIMIFVADALRWDYLPKEIKQLGITIKTIAQSCHTPTSFASIATGMNPPKHGVDWFYDTILKKFYSIFDLPTNTSYFSLNESDPVRKVLGFPSKISLSKIREPFIYLEKNTRTHSPYNPLYKGNAKQYDNEYRKKPEIYLRDYKTAVERSSNDFFDRIKILEKRGLLDRTLIIYTSDHGELLGEYGFIGHQFPCAPELVYVPTVFIHPSLDFKNSSAEIMRHIDILPTIINLLRLNVAWEFEGINIFDTNDQILGYCRTIFPALYPWKILTSSVWDEKSGYVKLEGASWKLLIILFQELILRSRSSSPFLYCKRVRTFGNSIDNADEILKIFEKEYTYGYVNKANRHPYNNIKNIELPMKIKIKIKRKIGKLKKEL